MYFYDNNRVESNSDSNFAPGHWLNAIQFFGEFPIAKFLYINRNTCKASTCALS